MRDFICIFMAFVVAPLTSNIGFGLAFYYRWPNDFYRMLEAEGVYHMFGPNVYVTGVTYVIAFIFGLPGYLLLRKLKLDKSYLIVAWAVVVGATFTYFERFGSAEWDWEYGVFPAIVVSLTAIFVLKVCESVSGKT